MKNTLYIVFLTFFQTILMAQDLSQCRGRTISSIQVPKDHFSTQSENFEYKYSYYVNNPNDPTIIYIPGGPGGASIQRYNYFSFYFPQVNILYIDPRGVQCNYYDTAILPLNFINSKQHAMDIVSIIKHLDLKNVILYGQSYGTVVATMAGFYMQQNNRSPLAIVLEGTLGKELDQFGYKDVWDAYVAREPQLATILASVQNIVESHRWIPLIAEGLTEGFEKTKRTIFAFKNFHSLPANEQKLMIEAFFPEQETDPFAQAAPGTNHFYCQVGLKEIFPPHLVGVNDIESGTLVYKPSQFGYFDPHEYCKNESVAFEGFSSIQYQLKSPIYYFHGKHDPNIPVENAKFHFSNQLNSQYKEFIEIENVGHLPLVTELSGCTVEIWKKIIQNESVMNLLDPVTHLCLEEN